MKHLNVILVVLVAQVFTITIQAQSLNFHKGTVKDAFELAQKQERLVFVDFYTDWCAPCKMMDRDVFTNADVVNYFNKKFINVKLDAEKGEGIAFAKKNKVAAYPTFIIFDHAEKQMFRMAGATSAKVFLEKVQKGLDDRRSPEALASRYAKGERNPGLINDYAFSLMELAKEEEGYKIVNEYFRSLRKKKIRKPENWFLFDRYTPGFKDAKAVFLFENQDYIAKKVGRDKVVSKVNRLLHSELLTYLSGYKIRQNIFDEQEYLALKDLIHKVQLPDSLGYDAALQIIDALAKKDFKLYIQRLNEHFDSLQTPARFVTLVNMGSNLKNENDEVKLMGADFLEQHAAEIKDKISSRSIQKTILDFRNEEEFSAVNFEKTNFNEALAKAKASDKLIFFDAYASWCGPCKVMDETVFADPVAGRFFNTKFINVKVDMEKGEGPALQQKYPVGAFPTYLIIDADGKELHRVVGAYGTEEFISLIEKGSRKQQGLTWYKEQYAQGNRDRQMVAGFAEALSNAYQKQELNSVLNDFFDKLSANEKESSDYMFVYDYSSGIKDRKFQYFLDHASNIREEIGQAAFLAILDKVSVANLMNEQVHFKKKGFARDKYPKLYKLDLPEESVTKTLLAYIDLIAEGDVDKMIAFQNEHVFKFSERNQLMTLYALLGVPNNGTSEQKKRLHQLLNKVLANTKSQMIRESLGAFIKNLEGKMEG